MSAKIISQGQIVESKAYDLDFNLIANPTSGYSFDCNEKGEVDTDAFNPDQQMSWADAHNRDKYHPGRVRTCINRYYEPTVIECDCGAHLSLSDPMTNDCKCGRAYNSSGQQVKANYGRAECLADGCAWDESDY